MKHFVQQQQQQNAALKSVVLIFLFLLAAPASNGAVTEEVYGYDLDWRAENGAACGTYMPNPPNGGWWGRKFIGPIANGEFSSCTAAVPVPARFLQARVKNVKFKLW